MGGLVRKGRPLAWLAVSTQNISLLDREHGENHTGQPSALQLLCGIGMVSRPGDSQKLPKRPAQDEKRRTICPACKRR